MSAGIATVVYALMILGLFWLDRDREARTSGVLWIPVVWLLLACSRSVDQWLHVGQPMNPMDSPAQYLLEGSPIDRAVYTGLLVLGLIVLVNRGRQAGRLLRANGAILLFFLYCAVSVLWSDYRDVAFKRWTKALGDLVMVLVVLSDREPFVAVKRLLARAAFLLVPLSILLIKYYPNLGKAYGRWDWKSFYQGVALNKNGLGAICLFFGLASAWRFLAAYQDPEGSGRVRRLIAHGVILMMALWLFWIANSMTSLACFLLGSLVLLAANSRPVVRTPMLMHLLVAVVLTVTVSVLFLDLGPGVLDTMGRDATLTDRTDVWTLVLSLTRNTLVGAGFESFWLGPRLGKIWGVYSWRPNQAHNGYLEIFLNLGWTGVVLLAVVIATGYRTALDASRRNLPVGSLGLACFVVGLVYNFTEAAFFRMMAPAWILFLLAITKVPERPHAKVRTSPRAQAAWSEEIVERGADATR